MECNSFTQLFGSSFQRLRCEDFFLKFDSYSSSFSLSLVTDVWGSDEDDDGDGRVRDGMNGTRYCGASGSIQSTLTVLSLLPVAVIVLFAALQLQDPEYDYFLNPLLLHPFLCQRFSHCEEKMNILFHGSEGYTSVVHRLFSSLTERMF
jgi:hypothetical protein